MRFPQRILIRMTQVYAFNNVMRYDIHNIKTQIEYEMEVYSHNGTQFYYYPTVKETVPVFSKLSDKDTNADSDEERNQYWEPQVMFDSTNKYSRQAGNKKLKNELCRNFMKYGGCNYGFKCQFAHGIDELRKNENQNSKYKTKECTSYYKDGFCPYGKRCNFLHNHVQNLDKKSQKKVMGRFDMLLNNYPELIAVERPRLKFFEAIEEK